MDRPGRRLTPAKVQGFFGAGFMGIKGSKPRRTSSGLKGFRFSHRGAADYAALLKCYRTVFNMPQPVVSRLTGFSPRSVAKWSEGEAPSAKQEKALVEMDRLLDGLSRVMAPGEIGRWLRHPNAAFDGCTPIQLVERGESDRLWRMLFDLESGQPG